MALACFITDTENGLVYRFYKEVIENSCNGAVLADKAQACLDAKQESLLTRPNARHPLMHGYRWTDHGPLSNSQDPYSDCAGPEGCGCTERRPRGAAQLARILSAPRDSRVLKAFVVMVAVILHASHVSHVTPQATMVQYPSRNGV